MISSLMVLWNVLYDVPQGSGVIILFIENYFFHLTVIATLTLSNQF